MYLNCYEILITSANEGLLYLPLIQSRIPVEWSGLTVMASQDGIYGCIMDGEVKMQGSMTGAIGRDLHRQVMALLTQGPGSFSGKFGEALEKISAIGDSLKNGQTVNWAYTKGVLDAAKTGYEEWETQVNSYYTKNGKTVPQAIQNILNTMQQTQTNMQQISDCVVQNIPSGGGGNTAFRKLDVAFFACNLTDENKTFLSNATKEGKRTKENFLIADLINIKAIFSENKIPQYDCDGEYKMMGGNEIVIEIPYMYDIGVECAGNKETSFLFDSKDVVVEGNKIKLVATGNSNVNIVYTFATSTTPEEMEKIRRWLLDQKPEDYILEDVKNPKRFAKENETLYIVRTSLDERAVNLKWKPSMAGNPEYKHISGHQISNTDATAYSRRYFSYEKSPLEHKSQFLLNGQTINLEIVPESGFILNALSPEFDITKYIKMAVETLRDYNLLSRQPTKEALLGANSGVNYFFQPTIAKLETRNEEDESSRLAYHVDEAKNSLDIGVKGDKDIPIPGLSFSFNPPPFGSCDLKFEGGVFFNVLGSMVSSTYLFSQTKEYLNDELPKVDTGIKLKSEIIASLGFGIKPKIEAKFCSGISILVAGLAKAEGEIIKIAPPEPPELEWMTFPAFNKGVDLSTSFIIDIKAGTIVHWSTEFKGSRINSKDIFN